MDKVTSVNPGSVYMMGGQFRYYVLVNNIEHYTVTPFDSASMCKTAMRDEVSRLRSDYGV